VRGRLAAHIVLAAVAVASCGDGDRLDTAEIERGIRREIQRDNPGTRVVEVTCPEEVERGKGIVFKCMVRGSKEGELAEATVTQVDDEGNVRYVVP
jgi:hypothetical protein